MDYKKQAIQELVVKLLADGFRPFVAESGTHGFYTDAAEKRLVSFQFDFYLRFFGNHTGGPKHGSGWALDEDDAGDFQKMFRTPTPRWAGGITCRPTTVAEHQAFFQDSSRYTEILAPVK